MYATAALRRSVNVQQRFGLVHSWRPSEACRAYVQPCDACATLRRRHVAAGLGRLENVKQLLALGHNPSARVPQGLQQEGLTPL